MTSDKRMSDERLEAIRRYLAGCCDDGVIDMDNVGGPELLAEIDALRADLAAARLVPDDAELQETLTRVRFSCGIDTSDRVQRAFSRLSAAKEEAERYWAEHEKRATLAQTDLNIAQNKLAQAERERDRAREAAQALLAAIREREPKHAPVKNGCPICEAMLALSPAPIPAQAAHGASAKNTAALLRREGNK